MSGHVVLATPRDGTTEGRLVIRGGLGKTTLGSDATMAELYIARCTGRSPRARYSGGTVELAYPRLTDSVREHSGVITLNGSLPWQIAVVGGMIDVRADLTRAALRSIDVDGVTARTSLDLPHPDGTMPIRLRAVGDTIIRRPVGVPVRVRIRRRARCTTVDAQTLAAGTGPTTLASPGFDRAVHRVDVSVDTAARLTVTTTGATGQAHRGPADVLFAANTWLTRLGVAGGVWRSVELAEDSSGPGS
jgi:hypothetical protein